MTDQQALPQHQTMPACLPAPVEPADTDPPLQARSATNDAGRGLGRPFWTVWASSSTSWIGDGISGVALPLLAATLTRNPSLIAHLWLWMNLPWLLFGLPSGVLADRVHRGLLLSTTEMLRAVLLVGVAVVTATGGMTLGRLYAAGFLAGVGQVMFSAGSHSLLPGMVTRANLQRANGFMSTSETVGLDLVGPIAGAAAFTLLMPLPFFLDALTFVTSGVAIFAFRARLPAAQTDGRHRSIRQDIRAGMRWILASPPVRLLTLVATLGAFCQAMMLSIVVLYGLEVLGLSNSGFGLLMAVAAVGGVAGGLVADRLLNRFGYPRLLLTGIALQGSAFLVAGSTSHLLLGGTALVVDGAAISFCAVSVGSLRYALVPAELQGRVGNTYRTVAAGCAPLGALLSGVIASHWGVGRSFMVAGFLDIVIVVVLAGAVFRHLPRSISEGNDPN